MRRPGRTKRVLLAAAVLAATVGVGVYYGFRPPKRAAETPVQPLRLSELEGKSVRVPSLPSIQMHLIPRTQPTPLSPVTIWDGTNNESSRSPVSP